MKKIMLGGFLAVLLALFCAGASAEDGPRMDQGTVVVRPGEPVTFTYTVPEGYEVCSESWDWFFTFSNGQSVNHFQDDYVQELFGDLADRVSWDGAGTISLPETAMVCVRVHLNANEGNPAGDVADGFVCVTAPEEGFVYTIEDGCATITGRRDELLRKELIIPDELGGCPVTAIGDRAFADLPSGVGGYIYLPDTITSIGAYAFDGSAYVTTVRLPQNLRSMGEGAFAVCMQMHTLYMPKGSLTEIPKLAFAHCYLLDGGRSPAEFLGGSVASIGENAFLGCSRLGESWTDGRLPDSLTAIGAGAFAGCA